MFTVVRKKENNHPVTKDCPWSLSEAVLSCVIKKSERKLFIGRLYGDLVTVDCWTVLLSGLGDSVT